MARIPHQHCGYGPFGPSGARLIFGTIRADAGEFWPTVGHYPTDTGASRLAAVSHEPERVERSPSLAAELAGPTSFARVLTPPAEF